MRLWELGGPAVRDQEPVTSPVCLVSTFPSVAGLPFCISRPPSPSLLHAAVPPSALPSTHAPPASPLINASASLHSIRRSVLTTTLRCRTNRRRVPHASQYPQHALPPPGAYARRGRFVRPPGARAGPVAPARGPRRRRRPFPRPRRAPLRRQHLRRPALARALRRQRERPRAPRRVRRRVAPAIRALCCPQPCARARRAEEEDTSHPAPTLGCAARAAHARKHGRRCATQAFCRGTRGREPRGACVVADARTAGGNRGEGEGKEGEQGRGRVAAVSTGSRFVTAYLAWSLDSLFLSLLYCVTNKARVEGHI
jgi:hypothetical protein